MKRFSLTIFSVIIVAVFFVSCHKQFQAQSVQYAGYSVEQNKTDSVVSDFLKPYSSKVGETMNDVMAQLGTSLKKEQPNGSLGNFLADAYLAMAQKKFDPAADVAFMNNGGIRLNTLQAGPLRRGSIYEVMPFDNLLVILKLTGAQLQQYLDHIAAEGGGGIAGLRMTIRDKKATDVYIDNKPLNLTATYTMVNSDYAVNGGGGYTLFKDMPMQKTGYLLRDAILDYCAVSKAAGKPIIVSAEKRIINGN
jgi:2',3'-cyclic-nucleotide 2'-phosphodiesterase (5'-nucleotidase family)